MAQSTSFGPNTPPRVPALSNIGLAALGAGLATAGTYKLLRRKRKKPEDKGSTGAPSDRK